MYQKGMRRKRPMTDDRWSDSRPKDRGTIIVNRNYLVIIDSHPSSSVPFIHPASLALHACMFNKTLRQAYSFIRTNGIGRRYRRSQREFSASAISSSEGPFDILFCGSDGFSVASLKAVKQAKGSYRLFSPC